MNTSGLGRTLRDERLNAVLAWGLVGFVGLVALANVVGMTGLLAVGSDPLWAGFALVVAVLGAIPAVAARNARAMLPWEVLALAALPLLVRTAETLVPFALPGTGRVATYLAVAAVALVIAVELHVFTPVEMDYRFAVLFVVITTMAAAGVWAVVRFVLDVYLGTSWLLPATQTEAALAAAEHELMFEFVYSTLAGVIAGVIFEVYFRRWAPDRDHYGVTS